MVAMRKQHEQPFSTVKASILPHYAWLVVKRKAALHLFRLLQRYNWCLREQLLYRKRWQMFWPHISPIERKLLRLFIMANCKGHFGNRFQATDVPVDFEPFLEDNRTVELSPDIAAEFRRILSLHYTRLATPAEIQQHWFDQCHDEYALLMSIGGLDKILVDLHPDWVGNRLHTTFLAGGWGETSARQMANTLSLTMEWFLNSKEGWRA